MYQKQCRLTRADKYYGKGGGGSSIAPTIVRRNLSQEWPKVLNKTRQWTGQEYPGFTQDEPILSQLYEKATKSPLLAELGSQAQTDLAARGALSPEEEGRIRTSTLATAGAMGMGNTPGTLGTELLNREQYRQQREGIARNFATGVLGQQFQLPLSVLQGGTQAFGSLTNPILQYLTQAFTPQVVGGTAAPGNNTGSAAIGAAGSIIGAAIPVIATAV
jgi:hypothetical protein